MWIMVAGPYHSGAGTAAARQANLDVLNRAAYEVWEKGHLPIIGVNMALPMIQAMARVGEERYEQLMMPMSLALTERCDAILRVGGPSAGADQEVERFRRRGLPIYLELDEIPDNDEEEESFSS